MDLLALDFTNNIAIIRLTTTGTEVPDEETRYRTVVVLRPGRRRPGRAQDRGVARQARRGRAVGRAGQAGVEAAGVRQVHRGPVAPGRAADRPGGDAAGPDAAEVVQPLRPAAGGAAQGPHQFPPLRRPLPAGPHAG